MTISSTSPEKVGFTADELEGYREREYAALGDPSNVRLGEVGYRLLRDMFLQDNPLDVAVPGGWWFDITPVGGVLAWSLIRNALISKTYGNEKFLSYEINGRGKEALKANARYCDFKALYEKDNTFFNVGAKKSSFWTKKGFELLGDFEEEEAKRLISFLEKSGFHAIMEQREAFLLVFADPKAVELYEHNCSFHDYLKYGSTKKVSEATWNLYPYIPLEENDQDE